MLDLENDKNGKPFVGPYDAQNFIGKNIKMR
jgi:hypothetical protein